jgi:hypothetical protein
MDQSKDMAPSPAAAQALRSTAQNRFSLVKHQEERQDISVGFF